VPPVAAGSAEGRPTAGATGEVPPGLLVPVQGVLPDQLQDTFTDARSEGRVHDAIDIMAPTGTPVLAVADGTIEKLFTSERGGLTVYQFEPDGVYCYYYAHLDRYADGLAEKQVIKRGDVIGYVGSTGNASPDAPHLHFEIHRLGPEKQWWKGEALNPYPVLRGAGDPAPR
ncbi:M23 family metallopeptidase, partial [Stenotrophomonas sp.]|uniref:M23 family metallopeptidase n=1 Tax=Stenotrophomonas sp. TaxID=69392 RepID=UPI0028AFFA53